MKPYTDLNGKAKWSLFCGDEAKKKIKRLIKKAAREKAATNYYTAMDNMTETNGEKFQI